MIRVLRDWLSTQPEDDDWDGELRWFNRSREWCGERYRIIVGDVMSEMEHEGGDVAPIHFGAEIELHLDNIGQWYDECERGRRGAGSDLDEIECECDEFEADDADGAR